MDDPYYVSPRYEEGFHEGRKELAALVDELGSVIDELGAHILKDEGMTDADHAMIALVEKALARIKEVL